MDSEKRHWELSPYEDARKKQIIPEEDREITVTSRFLESELSCAICLDILRNTRTTKECLHRFCGECISQALRSGNKECPNCRKKLASMRSLRPDPLFDEIIRVLFPDREDLDRQQSQLLMKLNDNNNRKAFVSSIEEGKRHQAERARGSRPPRKATKESSQDRALVPSASTSTSETGSVRGEPRQQSESTEHSFDMEDSPPITFDVIPFNAQLKGKNEQLVKRWKRRRTIKVKSAASVAHLCRFILCRLIVERHRVSHVDVATTDYSKVKVYVRLSVNDFRLLEYSMTLAQVYDLYGNTNRRLCLAFTITGGGKSSV